MKDMRDLCGIIEDELGKIADKGLNTGNLETAYKLIDMYKDIKNTEYWETKGEYYMQVLSEMRGGEYSENDGYSQNGNYSANYSERRDSRGRYSRNDGMGGNSMNSYNNGSSYARRGQHYVRGHYSRSNGDPYNDYMSEKQSYRSSGKSEDCKRRMLDALEDHMDKLTQELGEMSRDSDCREERETINKYIDKLKKMM